MDFPYPFSCIPGTQTLLTLQQVREAGGMPIILGDQENFDAMLDQLEVEEGYQLSDLVQQMLDEVEEIDAQLWFQEREQQDPEYFAAAVGEWPEEEEAPSDQLIAHCDMLTGQPYEQVYICQLPAAQAWMAACYLHFGGWNAAPFPAEHAAVLKYWQEKYGAIVTSVAGDVIELQVSKPVTDRAQAMQLAKEQFIYCPDLVYQGVGSIAGLAASLMHSSVWFFWWD